jgi:hypothetical protein
LFSGPEYVDHYQGGYANRKYVSKGNGKKKGGDQREDHRGQKHVKCGIAHGPGDLVGDKKEEVKEKKVKGELAVKAEVGIEEQIGLFDQLDGEG